MFSHLPARHVNISIRRWICVHFRSPDASRDKQKKHRDGDKQNNAAETLKWVFDTVRASPTVAVSTQQVSNSRSPDAVTATAAPISSTQPVVVTAVTDTRQANNTSSSSTSSSSPSRNSIPQDRRRRSDPSINQYVFVVLTTMYVLFTEWYQPTQIFCSSSRGFTGHLRS